MINSNFEQIKGLWEGYILIPNQQLAIIVKFGNNEGTLSIPVQGVMDYPLSNIQINEKSLIFEANILEQNLKFEGNIENEKINGTYFQNVNGSLLSFLFELIRDEEVGNFVDIHVEKGTLKVQIEIPSSEGKFPLMVIIAGSGPTDRNGNSILINGKNNSLKMIAEGLLKHGIASIRYDKRGVGMNKRLGEREEDVTIDCLIKDAIECIKYAKNDERFSHVGVIGHSEGSLIGMLAALESKADLFISLAGIGRKPDQVIIEQLKNSQLSDVLLEESKSIIYELNNNQFVENVSPELQILFRLSVQPYLISWFKYDPSKIIQNIEVPILIVNGKRDIQVPESDAKSLHESNPKSCLLLIENMNHILKDSPLDREGNLLTYTKPDLPLSNGLLEGLSNFILENTSK